MNTRTHDQHEKNVVAAGREFRCIFHREIDSGYRVTCTDLPRLLAFGDTLAEARDNAREEMRPDNELTMASGSVISPRSHTGGTGVRNKTPRICRSVSRR